MATEKFFVHKEDGSLVRIKGRLVRFLDNEAPTGSDKSAIRTSLEVSPDAEGLVQADVGTAPNEVPVNGMLGDMAYQSAEAVSVDKLEVTDKIGVGVAPSGNPLEVAGTNGNFSIAADGNTANFSRNAANYIAATADTSSSLAALAKHSFQVHTGNPTVEALRVDALGALDVKSVAGASAAQFPSAASVNGITALPSATGTPFLVGRDTGSLRSAHFAGNLKFDSGYGIDFSATSDGSGTASSEVFSDYEEGSATVSFVPDGGTVTIKSTHNTIYYRKVGKLVHIAGELVVDSVSSPTGEFKISGLPYASENVNNNRSAISIHTSLLSSSSRLAAFVEKNQSFAYVRLTGSTGYGQTSATVLQANTGIVIGGSYHTA